MHQLLLRVCLPVLVLAAPAVAQLTVALPPSKDNTLYESATGALSNALGEFFFVGSNAIGSRRRGVIAFDVAGKIPAGAKIVSVALTLEMTQTQAGAVTIGLYPASADWGEGTSKAIGAEGQGAAATTGDATWIHRFYSSASWQNAGGDFAATPSATQSVGVVGSYTWGSTAALAADVQGWLDKPTTNFGWLILGAESGTTAKKFASRENSIAALRPVLSVTYDPKASVTATGAGCRSSVNQVFSHGASGVPSLGNLAFALTAAGAPANMIGVDAWAIGLQSPPLPLTPSCTLQVSVFTLFLFTPAISNAQGQLTWPLPIPNVAALSGVQLDSQAIGFDAGAAGGLISSNALTILLGR